MNIRTVALAIFTRNDDEVLVQEFQFPEFQPRSIALLAVQLNLEKTVNTH